MGAYEHSLITHSLVIASQNALRDSEAIHHVTFATDNKEVLKSVCRLQELGNSVSHGSVFDDLSREHFLEVVCWFLNGVVHVTACDQTLEKVVMSI